MGPKTRVQWRLLAILLPLLALVFIAAAIWTGRSQEAALLAADAEIARGRGLTAIEAVHQAMVSEGENARWDRVERRLLVTDLEGVEILDRDGRVRFSNDPARRGRVLSVDTPLCASCHAEGAGDERPVIAVHEPENGPPLRFFAQALRNDERCSGCHSNDGPSLGVILVSRPLQPTRSAVRELRLGLLAAGVLALLLTAVATRLVLGRFRSTAPRRRLQSTTSPQTVESFAETVKRLEHQRDNFEILYRFTDQVSRAVDPAERRRRAVELATTFLGTECVLVRVDDPGQAGEGSGRITMKNGDSIEDHPFTFGPEGRRGVPTFLDDIIRRWLSGEFDGRTKVAAAWVVAYPLARRDRHLGLLLIPAPGGDEKDGPSPVLVQALTRHVAIALEFTDLQAELVGQARLAAIGETVAGLAHCLKNILNGLRAGQYILDRAVDREDQLKLRRGYRVLRMAIGSVENLTSNMLYVAKERTPERTAVDPNDVLREIMDIVRKGAAAKGIEIREDLDETIGEMPLDRMTIYRAVLNLVSNAMDACEDSEDGQLVTVSSHVNRDGIVLSVTDDGVGMSEAILGRLFTKFFTTKAGKGTGLGLPVVKKIIEEHGGRLEIQSELGRGSTFSIHLPRG